MTLRRPRSEGGVAPLVFQVWLFTFVALAGTTLLGRSALVETALLAIFGIPVLVAAVFVARGPRDMLDVAVIVGLAAHVLVSLFSRDVDGSLRSSFAVALYAAVFWLARAVGRHSQLRQAVVVAIAMALLFWLGVIAVTWMAEKVASVATFGWPPPLQAYQPYAWGSINTPPMLVLLTTPFLAWLRPGPMRRVAIGVWVAAAVVIVPFSVGRAAWLAIAVAVLAFGLTSNATLGAFRLRRLAAIGGSAVAGALVLLAVTRGDALASALDSRLRLWDQALGLFATDPLTGSGPSTYPWARLAHAPDYTDRVAAMDAHSVYLQTLADGGLVLLAALAGVVAGWLAMIVRRRALLDLRRRIAVAALLGYAAAATLDDLSFLPSVVVVLIVLAAWSIPEHSDEHTRSGRARALVVPASLLLATAVAAPAVISTTVARLTSAEARAAAVRGDWAEARVGFERAAELHETNALYAMSVGLSASALGDRDAAVEAYERARDLSPGDPRPWGALAEFSDDPIRRLELLEAAARRSNDPQYAYRLGVERLEHGTRSDAVMAFAVAAAIEPRVLATLDESIRPEVHDALPDAIDIVGPIGGRDPAVAMWDATLAVGGDIAEPPAAWNAVLAAVLGDYEGARELAAQAVAADPRSLTSYLAADAVARFTCDRPAYDEAQRMLALLGPPVPATEPFGERPVGVYREPELGDYQPMSAPDLPATPAWPIGLVEVPDCGW